MQNMRKEARIMRWVEWLLCVRRHVPLD